MLTQLGLFYWVLEKRGVAVILTHGRTSSTSLDTGLRQYDVVPHHGLPRRFAPRKDKTSRVGHGII